jgi:hypothetical protein
VGGGCCGCCGVGRFKLLEMLVVEGLLAVLLAVVGGETKNLCER